MTPRTPPRLLTDEQERALQQLANSSHPTLAPYKYAAFYALADLLALSTALAEAERAREEAQPYLKDGESVGECLSRNRADINTLMSLLVEEKRQVKRWTDLACSDADTKEMLRLSEENARLRAALEEVAHHADDEAGFMVNVRAALRGEGGTDGE